MRYFEKIAVAWSPATVERAVASRLNTIAEMPGNFAMSQLRGKTLKQLRGMTDTAKTQLGSLADSVPGTVNTGKLLEKGKALREYGNSYGSLYRAKEDYLRQLKKLGLGYE